MVLVDDGSTDDSAKIAARYVREDSRFRLHRQENRGLGAARNAGIELASGDYLTFLDSDDVLPPYALEVLVGALELTGSDFASGNVALFTSAGLRQSPLHRGTHRHTRLRVNLARQRNLVYDRLACNKVFRRSFWERHGLRFPEGVRYEDIPVTVPAYALAESVDVLDIPVYYWRQREAGTEQSISQRLGEVGNLVDRFAAVESARRSLAAVDRKLKDWYDETALQSDLRMLLDLLPDGNDDYRRRFLDLANEFLAGVDSTVVDRLTPRLRVAWRLVRARAEAELLDVVRAGRNGATPPVVRRGRGHYLDLPLLDARHPAAPREAYQVSPGLRTEVLDVRWVGDCLQVSGTAYDVSRGAARPWTSPRLLWLREDSGRRRILPMPSRARRVATVPSSVPYDWSGFSLTLDPRRLRGRGGDWLPGTWTFNIAAFSAGRPLRRMLGTGEARPALPSRWVADRMRVVPYVRAGQLRLRVDRPESWVTSAAIDDETVLIEGGTVRRSVSAVLRLCRVPGVTSLSYPVELSGGDRWFARVPLAELAAAAAVTNRPVLPSEVGAGWRVSLDDGDGEPRELPALAGFAGLRHPLDGAELVVRPAEDDMLWLRVLPAGPIVSAVRYADHSLSFTADLPAASEAVETPETPGSEDLPRIVLRRRLGADPTAPAVPDVELSTEPDPASRAVRFVVSADTLPVDGDWMPLYVYPGRGAVDLPFGAATARALPRDVLLGDRRLELLPDRDRQVFRISSPKRGTPAQRR